MSVTLQLAIDAVLCGPASIGTVSVVRILQQHLGLSLSEAKGIVDQAAFEGQEVSIPVASVEVAEKVQGALAQLPEGPGIVASIHDGL